MIVINGIEAALWDLKGKMLGVPVYELLGGRKHESLPAYATGGPSNFPLEKLAAKVDFYQSLGFRGFKVGAGSLEVKADGSVEHYIPMRPAEAADFEGRKVRFLREHVGRDVNIMLDGHMGNNDQTWDLGIAQAVMKAVACTPWPAKKIITRSASDALRPKSRKLVSRSRLLGSRTL